jgi:hypothetical protein
VLTSEILSRFIYKHVYLEGLATNGHVWRQGTTREDYFEHWSFPFKILSAVILRCPAEARASVSSLLDTSLPNAPITPADVVWLARSLHSIYNIPSFSTSSRCETPSDISRNLREKKTPSKFTISIIKHFRVQLHHQFEKLKMSKIISYNKILRHKTWTNLTLHQRKKAQDLIGIF